MLKAFKKLLSNGSVTRKTLFCLIFSKLPVLGLCPTKVMECYWWPKGFRFKGQVAEMMLYWKTNKLLLPMPPVFLGFFSTCMMPSFCFFIGRSDICKYVHNVWSHISKSEFPLADVISSFFPFCRFSFSLVGEIEVFCSLQDISWQVSQSKTWFASFWTRKRV